MKIEECLKAAKKYDSTAVITGKSIKMHCPFHTEKTPSFIINPKIVEVKISKQRRGAIPATA